MDTGTSAGGVPHAWLMVSHKIRCHLFTWRSLCMTLMLRETSTCAHLAARKVVRHSGAIVTSIAW